MSMKPSLSTHPSVSMASKPWQLQRTSSELALKPLAMELSVFHTSSAAVLLLLDVETVSGRVPSERSAMMERTMVLRVILALSAASVFLVVRPVMELVFLHLTARLPPHRHRPSRLLMVTTPQRWLPIPLFQPRKYLPNILRTQLTRTVLSVPPHT